MINKLCKHCNEIKLIKEFYRCSYSKDGYRSLCIKCINAENKKSYQRNKKKILERTSKYQKLYRKDYTDRAREIYSKTIKYFISSMWKHRVYLAKKYNRELAFTKEEFINWVNNNPKFYELYEIYKKSGYIKRLAPSIDRINNKLGYTFNNIQIITHGENARKHNH